MSRPRFEMILNGKPLGPADILAYILTGDPNGEGYELDPDQVGRVQLVVETIAENRMTASLETEIPPLSQSEFRRDANLN